MKYLKYILIISSAFFAFVETTFACGPIYPEEPYSIEVFRCCPPEMEYQWQEGCRSQEYDKAENCLLWQKITSSSIPLQDIEKVIYSSRLSDIIDISNGIFTSNKFAQWLSRAENAEDMEYIRIAKEIEEIRGYMNNPWYYAYDEDAEHLRLKELQDICEGYAGKRHRARYALQLIRLNFAVGDFKNCIRMWEKSIWKMPQDIVTDMIASYVGGAYHRCGNRTKAIELFTRSQDIGSLLSLNAWDGVEKNSGYSDKRVKQLEFIFNRFPDSPVLSIKLQKYVKGRERFVADYEDWKRCGFHGPTPFKTYWEGDSLVADDEKQFYNELKQFSLNAIASETCRQKGMWHYALGFLAYLDGNQNEAMLHLQKAEQSHNTSFLNESIRAFRFLLDATQATNSSSYRSALLKDLKWLDKCMSRDIQPYTDNKWRYDNKFNYEFYYWQDIARKVILGEICPKMIKEGNTTLALQLANYTANRVHQLIPLYRVYNHRSYDTAESESYNEIMPFDEYRKIGTDHNDFDYSNQFFELINSVSAAQAAKYQQRIAKPLTALDKFLNEKSYVDPDYINDIIGTLYLREMNYDKAVQWLSKVSTDYQRRTNIAKEGYFKLDPFSLQSNKKHYIKDPNDYKLRFAQEMLLLEKLTNADSESNRKANAKIRYAIGLRNSFGQCWYLTDFGYSMGINNELDDDCDSIMSDDRKGFQNNFYAQKAYRRVEKLMNEALAEFTDPEQAAKAHLLLMNYKTLINKYPTTKAAKFIQSRCDNYYDYALHKR